MKRCVLTLAAAMLLPALAQAQSVLGKTATGNPGIKSIQAIGVAPGALLIGDGAGGQVVAVKLPELTEQNWSATEIAGFQQKVGESLGTDAKGVEIVRLIVEPKSRNAFILVKKNQGKETLVLTMDSTGKIREFPLTNVEYARVAIPADQKSPVTLITDIAWSGNSVLLAAQANETFASKIVVIPGKIDDGSQAGLYSAETYHVAHRKWETKAPIRTLIPFSQGGKNYLIGAFTCTPIVKYSLDNLKPGANIKGESMIEIGSQNSPRDMFAYEKDGKTWILMSTLRFGKNLFGPSPYWTVKVSSEILNETAKLNENAVTRLGNKTGEEWAQLSAPFHGVTHMDRLDRERALAIRTDDKGGSTLAVIALP